MDPLIKSQLLYQLSYAPAGHRPTVRLREALLNARCGFVQPQNPPLPADCGALGPAPGRIPPPTNETKGSRPRPNLVTAHRLHLLAARWSAMAAMPGPFSTMPRSFTGTSAFLAPGSMAISAERKPNRWEIMARQPSIWAAPFTRPGAPDRQAG